MAKAAVKLKPGNRAKVRREIADYLVARYAPGLTLKVADCRIGRKRTRVSMVRVARADSADPNMLVWQPLNGGFTTLLHEIGHHRLEGHGTPKSALAEIVNEAVAWRWAEWAARQENLWFDYEMADRDFATYTRSAPIKINWRKKDVF